ncbi:ATP-binding protein [Rubinisphaera italica]|uniref:histidine kinase n=1 Tax=Rubinisphaera italica TaxID=2527969 RepID=A0A5C5XCU5_9PLAN|nr:ATP-binding protein [Rubinisphaera italica]TWT60800.1 Sensor kinase CusS [Rubinisphaera italica]
MNMSRSLHGRLIVFVGLTVITLFTISGVTVSAFLESTLWSEFDASQHSRALMLSQLIEQDHDGLIYEWREGTVAAVPLARESEALTLWKRGHIEHVYPENATPIQPGFDQSLHMFNTRLDNGESARVVRLTFQPRLDHLRVEREEIERDLREGIPSAQVTLLFARSTVGIETTIQKMRLTLCGVGIIGLIVTLLATGIAVNYGLRPLDHTAQQISTLNIETLSERLENEAEQPRELQPLIHTINQLLDRLEATFERERAFSADVAHELRTPLAGLRAKSEVALSKPRSSEQYQETIQQCLLITEQATAIVESLLATTQQSISEIRKQEIDINNLLTDIVREYQKVIDKRELTVLWNTSSCETVSADPNMLTILFRNLIDNAVSYADAGTTITIEAVANQQELTIEVSNTAQDFSSKDIDRVFERFWRADTARAATGLHSGLGLSLCRRLVESLGGKIEASYFDHVFSIRLKRTYSAQ